MSNKRRSVLALTILIIAAITLSACTQSLSSAPAETPTLLPTGLFVSPVASVENPMEMIEQFAKQTEMAQTAVANGGTPVAVETSATPDPFQTVETPSAPETFNATPTNANADSTQNETAPTAENAAPPPALSGDTYILQNGEWPFCIARRYNVDPDAMLRASGLTSPDIYYPGLKLVLPRNTSFSGSRVLAPHPTTYTVASGNESLYSIACKYGDVDPNAIASANGISVAAKLTVGQALQIP
ncbi:MAG: LysM peptidoglycan-binding domain-containing protein [Anaerolineales bacterium]|nr:LysM peptidoglycan-binding domain-containing protein [Anaerolineales bacterium]